MQKNTSVTLGEHFEQFIAAQMQTGQYASASETIRAGLRLLETQQIKLQALREALRIGEESGDVEYDFGSFIKEMDKELGYD